MRQKIILDWKKIIKFPLRYDPEGGWICDKDGGPVLQIRGYGKILSKLQYNTELANKTQDDFAEAVTSCLNNFLNIKNET